MEPFYSFIYEQNTQQYSYLYLEEENIFIDKDKELDEDERVAIIDIL